MADLEVLDRGQLETLGLDGRRRSTSSSTVQMSKRDATPQPCGTIFAIGASRTSRISSPARALRQSCHAA